MTLDQFCKANDIGAEVKDALRLHLDLHEGRHDNLSPETYALAYATIISQWLDRA
jgi:hypothetical protein